MFTTQNPTHCPKCMSKNVILGDEIFEKDPYGEDTDIVIRGEWFCHDCGNCIGRKISRYDNDIDKKSL